MVFLISNCLTHNTLSVIIHPINIMKYMLTVILDTYNNNNIFIFPHRNPNEGNHDVPSPWPQFSEAFDERLVVNDDSFVETVPTEQAEKYYFFMNEFKDYMEFPEYREDRQKPITGKCFLSEESIYTQPYCLSHNATITLRSSCL